MTGGVSGKEEERARRLAEALRENLRKRKAQAREMGKGVVPAKAGTSGQDDAGD